jgi:hypothetical protein
MNLDKFKVFINNIKNLASDPEKFLTSKYQRRYNPNSFRIELYTVRKYILISSKLRWLKLTNPKATSLLTES